MKKIPWILLYIFLAPVVPGELNAQAPVFNSVMANGTSIQQYEKFELTIDLTANYSNAYDYDDISTQCIFTAPGGRKDTVDGFYMENYSVNTTTGILTDLGTHNFKVRYAPNEEGSWNYILSATNSAGTTTRSSTAFQCSASPAHGFIKKNNTNYLSFDDGSQYIPVGEDMGWQDNNIVTDYTSWLGKLSSNGGNFIRVWMSDWAFALEWKNGNNGYQGLKKYKQGNAYYLDWLLDKCKDLNVYMMLCLNHHGQVSTQVNSEWSNNPYNATNGGPCTNTWDFFSNATAKAAYKNRQRYIIARYGYSTNLQSWELFNEIDWTDQFDTRQADVTSWHNEMSSFIKSKDVYKHLVTTSYAYDTNDPDTWQLPNIDFTQTHYYVNSPNIETALAGGSQNYLSLYNKPTLNGEFGLGGDGSSLSITDPNGVYIHNAIWGSSFGGAMGSAMTWWWDNYIDPQNLYYHYKPLSAILSTIKLKDGNYKKTIASVNGGGTADLAVSPGEGFVKATASDFTIDASGNITPAAANLSQYLFGSIWNTQYRNPPTFHITYPVEGQFKVATGSSVGTLSHITIYVDGVLKLDGDAVINTTYAVTVSAGAHTIKVDNSGTDWTTITSYIFTNVAPALDNYVLRSADNNFAAGWLLNKQYNWKYLQDHGGTAPSPVNGSSIVIPGMSNGNYTIALYNCSSGSVLNTINATATDGTLTIVLPIIAWDIAFTAANESVLPLVISEFYGEQQNNQNILHIEIAQSNNLKNVLLERSADGIHFSTLSNLSTNWSSVNGTHVYVDALPLHGNNFYRLNINDNDGREGISTVVLLFNSRLIQLKLYPNPFKDYLVLQADAGKYSVSIKDQQAKNIYNRSIDTDGSDVKFQLGNLLHGVYYLSITDAHGNLLHTEKILKQ